MVSWIPKRRTIEEDILEEEARLEAIRATPTVWQAPVQEPFAPEVETPIPTFEQPWGPRMQLPEAPTLPPLPTLPVTPKKEPKEAPEEVPFWQRALQVFAAPFQWVDENIIEPGLGLTGTALGFVPETKRKAGEDFWEWQKRSWKDWESPGIDVNVPWSDEPWRVDVRGVMELAPWLLIPGAGQVGGATGLAARLAGKAGTRAARGVSGILGQAGLPGRVLGTAVEYSPWGLVEKTAGVALRGGIRAAGKITGKVSTKIGDRLYGKIPEPEPPSAAVVELTKWFDEIVVPAREVFKKEGLPALRAKQGARLEAIAARYRRGEITALERTNLEDAATKIAESETKAGFAVKVEGVPEADLVFSGGGRDVPSNWFARGIDKPLDFAKARLASGRGGTPTIRVYKISDIEAKLGTSIDELTEGLGKVTPSTEYSYVYLQNVKPIAEIELAKGFKTQVQDIRTGLAGLTAKFNKEQMDELLHPIYKAAEGNFEAKDAARALRQLFLKGELPEPRHFTLFARIYGPDFAKSVKKLTELKRSILDKVIDIFNLPRAVLASGDLSATFRQGLILLLVHPTKAPRAFWRQLKGFASEKITLEMDDVLRADVDYQELVNLGVEFTAIRKGARMALKEEPFFSNLAQALPVVRRSERAFTTFLNEMRLATGKSALNTMKAQGASQAELKLMAKFINLASGRGVLPANLDRYAPALNTVLFSAKYQMSTLQLPRQIGRMFLSKNPYMRKEAAKALITFVGGGAALVSLLQATNTGKVEIDPRSGDFGKIVIGETRLDIWRGYVQYARFMAQMLTSERKSAYGHMNKAQRSEIASRFLQTKASPAIGLFADLLKGETFMGEPIFNDTTGFTKAARDRLLPLALQDIIDAMEQSGTNGLWTAAPAMLGVGVLTYVNDLVRVKERIAREMGYETWDEIDPLTQREVQNRNVELQAAYLNFDRQVMGTAWGDWRIAGQAIETVFEQNVEEATAQYRKTGDGVQFRGKISDAFTARRGGYDARNKESRFEEIVRRNETRDTAEALIELGPEQMAIRIYTDALYGKDMYDEFGDYRFDEAEIRKEQLRNQLGPDMFNYVEEFRGLKYETLPPEYQELAQAKIILRPYWQVKDKAERSFGKPKTEWQQRRIDKVISRMRKMMRRQNPEMEKYYQMFYVRQ